MRHTSRRHHGLAGCTGIAGATGRTGLRGEEVAEYTEIVILGGDATQAIQYDTAVVPTHRGHKPGFRQKASMTHWFHAEYPHVNQIQTERAEDRTYRRSVNDQLGFRAYRVMHEFQPDL